MARGNKVTVLTIRHSPELKQTEVLNGVQIIRLHPVSRFSRGMIAPSFLWVVPFLIARHDVVQIHTPLPEGPIVGLWCRLLNRPMLMSHHGDLVMPSGIFNQLVQTVGYYILLLTGWLATVVTSYNQDYAGHSNLLLDLQDKLTFIHPPVEIPPADQQQVQLWRHELGLDGKLVIGFAGRWVEEKGFDILLQAFPLIQNMFPNAHLVFAGEPHVVYDDFYKKCTPFIEPVKEHFTNVGLIREQQQMANFYALCDLFVQPSRTDMLGLTQVEAMLSGTPVVTSDIPGARTAVRETGFGSLSPEDDPVSLAMTICHVLQHRKQYFPIRERVRQIFNTENTLDKYQKLFNALVVGDQYAPLKTLPDQINIDTQRK